jgi:hypothetical protein
VQRMLDFDFLCGESNRAALPHYDLNGCAVAQAAA